MHRTPALCAVVVFASFLAAQDEPLVSARLVADRTTATPGSVVWLGVVLTVAPEWHVYWRDAGASGSPTAVKVTAPEGVRVGDVLWPAPRAHLIEGIGTSWVYEEEVLLPIRLEIPENQPKGKITIKAQCEWMVCSVACTLGQAVRRIEIAIDDQPVETPDASRIRGVIEALPLSLDESSGITVVDRIEIDKAGAAAWIIELTGKPDELEGDVLVAPFGSRTTDVAPARIDRSREGKIVVRVPLSSRKKTDVDPEGIGAVLRFPRSDGDPSRDRRRAVALRPTPSQSNPVSRPIDSK